MKNQKSILFLCTGNSCRSQMAEGIGRFFKGDKFKFFSAGTQKQALNKNAVKVMAEIGIDISQHYSKTLEDLNSKNFDYVFTVCSHAQKNCPYIPDTRIIHKGFDDPPHLTRGMEKEEEILKVYGRVRDEIKKFILDIETYLGE